jgi:hypothetical protein
MQAHDQAVRSMMWSHNENWMVTGDDGGCIKFVTPSSCMIHTLLWLLFEIDLSAWLNRFLLLGTGRSLAEVLFFVID